MLRYDSSCLEPAKWVVEKISQAIAMFGVLRPESGLGTDAELTRLFAERQGVPPVDC
jgi:hypothetical protein